jgi:Icc-related predicted phosphoesterase
VSLLVIYATDLHGDTAKYRQLLKIARSVKAVAMLNGGDLFPTNGDLLSEQAEFVERFLPNYFEDVQAAEIPFICCLGNDDLAACDLSFSSLVARFSVVHNLTRQSCRLGDYEIVGLDLVVDYPYRLKDRCRLDTDSSPVPRLRSRALLSSSSGWHEVQDWHRYIQSLPSIDSELTLLPAPSQPENTILLFHMPPDRVGLDCCDDGRNVGSSSIRRFIEDRQPRVSLHGHIHESPEFSGVWKTRLNKSLCIQPGQGSSLTYVVLDLESCSAERVVETVDR